MEYNHKIHRNLFSALGVLFLLLIWQILSILMPDIVLASPAENMPVAVTDDEYRDILASFPCYRKPCFYRCFPRWICRIFTRYFRGIEQIG